MRSKRPGLFMHLLMRKLDEGATFNDATDWALTGVQDAYRAVKESVFGPPAIQPVEHGYGRRRADAA
jgi:hypothetical protein